MSKKSEIYELHLQNPTWTARQLAEAVNCSVPYVRASASRGRYKLPRTHTPPVINLIDAAKMLLDHYTELVNSGDAGNWNPEDEPVVINLRAALRMVTNS